MMNRLLGALLVVALAGSAPLRVAGQNIACVPSLSNYTDTVPSLSIFTQFTKLYAAAGFDPNPNKGYAVFAPNDAAWRQLFEIVGTKIGGSGSSAFADGPSQVDPAAAPASSSLTARQVDILLSVGLYHYTRQDLGSPAAFLAANNVQSALGDYTGYNVSMYFETVKKQIVVEGVPLGNNADLTKAPAKVCNSSVYEIDTVLLPSNSISEIPPFTAIIGAQGAAGGPVGSADVFALPLAPDAEGISVTATEEGKANSTVAGAPQSINGDGAQAPETAAVAATKDVPQAGHLAARAVALWQTYAVATAVALVMSLLM